jgi:Ca-activated chloride channel family protein
MLWLLAVIPLLLAGIWVADRRAARWRRAFDGTAPNWAASRWASLALGTSLAGTILALAGPFLLRPAVGVDRSGMTVVLGLDVSTSMLAEDVAFLPSDRDRFPAPNRLNRGRAFALDLLNRLKGERVGVFLFARDGVEVAPPTGDYDYLRFAIRHIGADAVVRPGSDLSAAVATGAMLAGKGGPRALVLISDGETAGVENGDPLAAVHNSGMRVHTVAVGRETPSLIPIPQPAVGDFYQDDSGAHLTTQADRPFLRRIAEAGNGLFLERPSADGAAALARAFASEASKDPATRRVRPERVDLSPLFLMAAAGGVALFRFAGATA